MSYGSWDKPNCKKERHALNRCNCVPNELEDVLQVTLITDRLWASRARWREAISITSMPSPWSTMFTNASTLVAVLFMQRDLLKYLRISPAVYTMGSLAVLLLSVNLQGWIWEIVLREMLWGPSRQTGSETWQHWVNLTVIRNYEYHLAMGPFSSSR